MMVFDKTRRPAVVLIGIAMLAGLLSFGGCSNSTSNSAYGSGDKRDDPTLKAEMKGAMEAFKAKTQQATQGKAAAVKGRH